jgi:hypothetical protein
MIYPLTSANIEDETPMRNLSRSDLISPETAIFTIFVTSMYQVIILPEAE